MKVPEFDVLGTYLRRTSLAILAALVLAGPAVATAAIVQVGSTYGVRVVGASSGATDADGITFDGASESFTRTFVSGASVEVTVNESQTALGGGAHEILVRLTSSGDLFPVADEGGFVNIGRPGSDPLNLLSQVRLNQAIVTLYIDDNVWASADFVSAFPTLFSSLNPWDGYFLNPLNSGGFTNSGGRGVNRVDLLFRVTEVPEPGTLALLGLGLVGLGLSRRRKVA